MSDQGWVCAICGYVHRGPEPPDSCPVCGAVREHFEPYRGPATVETETMASESAGGPAKIVIVGAGIAGVSAAETLRQVRPVAEVVLISKETVVPYYRLNLTRYVAGEITDDALPIHDALWYEEQGVRLLLGTEITAVNLSERCVHLNGNRTESFDRLLITCGASPFVPPIPGASCKGVIAFRTVEDARTLMEAAKPGAKCVCIGGGLLGLETAGGLAKRGAEVTVLEGFDWLLPRQLNQQAARILATHLAELGVIVRCKAKTVEISGGERVRGVRLEDGTQLPADVVVIAVGVRPNVTLARNAELDVKQGIVVDNHLASSHPDVFAAGDVAEHVGVLYGLWEPARYQGAIAAMNAAGLRTEFGGLPRAASLKVVGAGVFSAGPVQPQDDTYAVIAQETEGRYYRFLFRENVLVGAILMSDLRAASAATRNIKNGTDLSDLLAKHPSAADIAAHLAER